MSSQTTEVGDSRGIYEQWPWTSHRHLIDGLEISHWMAQDEVSHQQTKNHFQLMTKNTVDWDVLLLRTISCVICGKAKYAYELPEYMVAQRVDNEGTSDESTSSSAVPRHERWIYIFKCRDIEDSACVTTALSRSCASSTNTKEPNLPDVVPRRIMSNQPDQLRCEPIATSLWDVGRGIWFQLRFDLYSGTNSWNS